MTNCFSNMNIVKHKKTVSLCVKCKKEDAMSFTDVCFNCYIGVSDNVLK